MTKVNVKGGISKFIDRVGLVRIVAKNFYPEIKKVQSILP